MARNLLSARTTNFLELVGNWRVYRVPPYQRDYSWDEEQWEDLHTDVLELRGDASARHYMGALVVEGQSDREFSVIDGQQRLATLSIFALAVIDALRRRADAGEEPNENRERAAALRARFIGEKDPASLVESSKLFLNETDEDKVVEYAKSAQCHGGRGRARAHRVDARSPRRAPTTLGQRQRAPLARRLHVTAKRRGRARPAHAGDVRRRSRADAARDRVTAG